ncbi:MAG: glycosyltransferase family 2 protein [Candidatus Moranbacteria bacterium]|nr:glycosyltransferase family 2 protein [Candidatus Moranbacteria bacterium]MBP9801942.1 glycosyltransferase family 2 protein [Candidatus Moranbacteria bacterium]
MDSHFQFPDPKTTKPAERRVQRVLEMLPGILTWTTILGMPLLAYFFPLVAAVFIILFDIYWVHRAIYISLLSVYGNHLVSEGKRIDWWERCQHTLHPEQYTKLLDDRLAQLNESRRALPILSFWHRHLMRKEMRRTKAILYETKALVPMQKEILDWREIVHVVLLPTAGEPAEIIEPAIQSLVESNFPKEQMIVLLATEERENRETRVPKVEYLQERFKGIFREFLVTTHVVEGGEMKCKASNARFAARELMKYLDERGIDYTKVIFSNFDCDSVAHPEYFAALTYAYVTDPKRLQRAYQPIPMYHNNLWDTAAVVRLVVTGSSFWHLFQSTRRQMVTFSSHSEPFDTLVKVGFWPVNMISEDSIIYWKCLSYFHGDYQVTPIHLPVSLDAVLAETWWKTIQNQYKQKRRWAYGIENFPVTMRALWPDRAIPLFTKLRISFEMVEGHYSWATTSMILTFVGWLPLILGGHAFQESVLAHNLPFMTKTLMTLGMTGLLISIPLALVSLPPKPKRYGRSKYFVMFFQWIFLPIVAFLSAFPAIDSQTRLLFGRYFGEFWVTEKMRKQ